MRTKVADAAAAGPLSNIGCGQYFAGSWTGLTNSSSRRTGITPVPLGRRER
jgi:hypothetical protein